MNDLTALAIAAGAILIISLIVIFGRKLSRPQRADNGAAVTAGAIVFTASDCSDGGGCD